MVPASTAVQKSPDAAVVKASTSLQNSPDAAVVKSKTKDLRRKVVKLFTQTLEPNAGECAVELSAQMEQALWTAVGDEKRAYKLQARTLAFNLGASDSALLRSVLDGSMELEKLVCLKGEELLPPRDQVMRKEQRDRYFRDEVQLKEGAQKRRRCGYGRWADREEAGLERQETQQLDSTGDSQPLEEPTARAQVAQDAREIQLVALPHIEHSVNRPSGVGVNDEMNLGDACIMDAVNSETCEDFKKNNEQKAQLECKQTPTKSDEDVESLFKLDTSNDEMIAQMLQDNDSARSSEAESDSSSSLSEHESEKCITPRVYRLPVMNHHTSNLEIMMRDNREGFGSSSSSSAWAPPDPISTVQQQLVAMGFDKAASEIAARDAAGSLEVAVSLVLTAAETQQKIEPGAN